MVTPEEITKIAKRHGLSADWYEAHGTKRLFVTKEGWDRWLDTTLVLSGTGEWFTDMAPIKAWKQHNRTRSVAAKSRPYWKDLKGFLQEALGLFGVQI